MIFAGPALTAAAFLGNKRPSPALATASAAIDETRIKPRRSIEILLLRREP